MMFDAVLFDNDGLLIDTEKVYVKSCQEIVWELFSLKLDLKTYQKYGYILGIGTSSWLREQGISEEHIVRFQEARNERYEEFLKKPIPPLKGVREVLNFLCEKNIPRAIVTATPRSHLELAHSQTGLMEHFSFAICNGEVPRSKPFPDGYLFAAEKLNIAPEKCLVLEDSPRGVSAGKAAGMTVWAVPSEQTIELDLSEADEIFESLEEVLIKLQSST
jgi:HAD superfamily hydrolase (TIGR01509 family)